MLSSEKKKALVLAAAVGLLAVYWGYDYIYAEKGKVAPSPKGVSANKAPDTLKAPIKVDLELLGRPRAGYTASRNIFLPLYKKPELPKPQAKGGKPEVVVAPLPPPPPPKPPEEVAADNAREEMQKFKALGFLKRKGRTDVFLSLGDDYYTAGKGDDITKGYYLKDIAPEFIVISDRGTKVDVKLEAKFKEPEEGSVATMPSPGIGGAKKSSGASAAPPLPSQPPRPSPAPLQGGQPGTPPGAMPPGMQPRPMPPRPGQGLPAGMGGTYPPRPGGK